MEKDNYNLIEKYLNGKLTKDEVKSFQIRLKKDELFREEYDLQKSMNIFLEKDRNLPTLESKMETIGNDFFPEEKKDKVISIKRNKSKWVAGFISAVTAAAVATLIVIFNPFHQKDLYSQYATHLPISLTEKSTENNVSSEAEIAYNQKNYPLAYEKLKLYLQDNPKDQKATLALGISALETGKREEAISIFENISKGNSTLKNYGTWNLALAHLKIKDMEKTKFYLNQIPVSGDKLFQNAQKLLKELD